MSSLYNRSPLSPFTRANSEQVNAELAKVQAAIDTLTQRQDDIVAGTPIASYTWIAFADSADGTANFTTGEASGRLYIGLAYNRGSPTESTTPSDYTWTRLRGEDGIDAGSGSDGLSVVEKFVYKRAPSAPSTPSGGSFNFSTQATTAPTGWSTDVPSGTDPVWISVAVAAKQGTGGTASFGAWSTPALAFTNGAPGTNGADGTPGSSVDVIFRRSAAQPSTPVPGMSTPLGWYTNVAAVPAGTDPMWSSFGTRPDPVSNWTWNVPVRVEGVDGTDGLPGVNGVDGVTHYTWIAYADAPDGTFNFTTGAPNGRVYQGIAANKTTAIESTNPADYVWSQYAGPPNFGLVAFNGNAIVAGNKLIKGSASPVEDWDASIHSTESFKGGASVTFVVDSTAHFMVGLNTDPTTDAGYGSIDFALYVTGTAVTVYESGSPIMSTGEPPAVGDVFTITYNGKTVVYSKNGFAFHTNGAPAENLSLFLDSSMVYRNTQYCRILSFTAVGQAGADGAPGAPGRDAITFVQDAAPTGTFVINDTWYAPSSKVWKRWDGSAWVQIMGNVASLDVITATYISANTIIASKFLTDQGVDLAAIVPGSLNSRLSSASSTDYSGGGWNGTSYNPHVNTGPINPTGTANVAAGHRAQMKMDVQYSSTGWLGSSTQAMITAYYRINGGAWVNTGCSFRRGSSTTPGYIGETEFIVPSAGTIQFAYGLTTSGGASGTSADLVITDHSLSVEMTFWK